MKVDIKKTYVAIIELTEADAEALVEVLRRVQGEIPASVARLVNELDKD